MKTNLGKVSPNPKLPNITKRVAKPKIAEGAGENMPEMGARTRPGGQYSAGGKGSQPASDTAKQTNAAPSGKFTHTGGNSPKGSMVPRGEHHSANHRAPTTHDEFHTLGNPKGGY